MNEQTSDPETTTVEQSLADEVARARNGRARYWRDYRGSGTLEPHTEALALACEVSDAEPQDPAHTAVWLVLVLAAHPGTPLVSAPGQGLSMGRFLKDALGGMDPLGGSSVASRTRSLQRNLAGNALVDPDHLVHQVVDLIRVSVKTTDRRPDPLQLHHELLRLLGGRGHDTAKEVVRSWYIDLLSPRR